MSLLPNPLGTGMMTPVGAPANPPTPAPTRFDQFSQGLLNNPLLGLGLGLLSGAQPGGTFASGAQQGLQNMMAMQRQQQAAQFNELRQQKMQAELAEIDRQKRMRETMAAQASGIFGTPAVMEETAGPRRPEFVGQPLMAETQAATGMYAQDPQMAGLMQSAYEADPMGVGQMLIQSQLDAAAQKAPNAMREIAGLQAMGYTPEQAVNLVMRKNQTSITMPGQQLRSLPDQMRLDYAEGLGNRIQEASLGANEVLMNAQQGKALLRDAVQSGFGTGAWSPIKGQASRWLGVNEDAVANQQMLFNVYGDQVMARIQQTKGAVSEKEMSYFQQISQGVDKTPFSNYVLTEIQRRKAARAQDMARRLGPYIAAGKDPFLFEQWYMENHDPFGDFDLDQLRSQYAVEIEGKNPASADARKKARAKGYVD